MPVKAVLFDFGDTLVSTDPSFEYEDCLVQLHRTLARNGISVPYEDFKKVHFEVRAEYPKPRKLKEVTFCFRISRALKCFGYNIRPADKRVVEAVDAFMQPVIEGRRIDKDLYKILRRLKGRHRLGIVSNFGHTPALIKTLERLDLTRFFDAVIVSADVGWRKPSRKIFEAALRALRVPASETVFVGDSLREDIEGARNAGMRTVLLLRRTSQEPTLGRAKPDRTIRSLEELPELLSRL